MSYYGYNQEEEQEYRERKYVSGVERTPSAPFESFEGFRLDDHSDWSVQLEADSTGWVA